MIRLGRPARGRDCRIWARLIAARCGLPSRLDPVFGRGAPGPALWGYHKTSSPDVCSFAKDRRESGIGGWGSVDRARFRK